MAARKRPTEAALAGMSPDKQLAVLQHRQIPDGERERAPPGDVAWAAEVALALRQLAFPVPQGGARLLVARCLVRPDEGEECMRRMRAALSGEAWNWWQAKVRHRHGKLPVQDAAAATVHGVPTAVWARAKALQQELPGAGKAAAMLAEAPAEVTGEPPSRVSIGRRLPTHPNQRDSRTVAEDGLPEIASWTPPEVPSVAAGDYLPLRRVPYEPENWQSKGQLARLMAWQPGRVLGHQGVRRAFCTLEALKKRVRNWRESADGHSGLPPVERMAGAFRTDLLDVLFCSEGGHMWSLSYAEGRSGEGEDEGSVVFAPLDNRQLGAAMGMEWVEHGLDLLVQRGISEPKVRKLIGQATHGGAVELVWHRLRQRLRHRSETLNAWHRRVGRTIGAIGAGAGFSALQLARAMGGSVVWAAEDQPDARQALEVLLDNAGHEAAFFNAAEDPELMQPTRSVGVEFHSLSCAQHSQAGTGDYLEATLNEVRVVTQGLAVRRPRAVIYENVPLKDDVRVRVETMLQRCAAYEWERVPVDPAVHCSACSHRARDFYVAVRLDQAAPVLLATAVEEEDEGADDGSARQTQTELAAAGTASAEGGEELPADVVRAMIEEDGQPWAGLTCGDAAAQPQAPRAMPARGAKRGTVVEVGVEPTYQYGEGRAVKRKYVLAQARIPRWIPERQRGSESDAREGRRVHEETLDAEVRRLREAARVRQLQWRWVGALVRP